ncbi:GNAT family N-acetyltransferase [Xinfangfangia sp. D13-10-4-6]|uniref:GNAT family N-acetyltransferase n=1 Tax=Pseudogemmobacter hezensis TaxID=2737662 RepID=UPI0015549CA8|nr:GNAT family protein [Pseudogemmobacter hezensis]NPD15489.1 GNAT family N-acetyltransferase [Pseudogemmobacter hezensis]
MSDLPEPAFGEPLPNWQPPPRPEALHLSGRAVALEPLDADRHAAALFTAFDGDARLWDYMGNGPFASAADYHAWAQAAQGGRDPYFLVLRDLKTGLYGGIAAYLRITPEAGTIEVGHICISPAMQRGIAVTEAMSLMMDWAFRQGYRRYEWKCNALNLPSRRAAQRLGFSYEGVFRQHMIVKGHSRDTAWFSVIDKDWPALSAKIQTWLKPDNFDAQGRQKARLSAATRDLLACADPAL